MEACINSRPLAKLSENADDENLSCITPSHLIIGKTLRPIHPEIQQHIPSSRKKYRFGKKMENKRQTGKIILEQMDKGVFVWTKVISQ